MTEEQLQQLEVIRARHAAATRGPWRWFVGSRDLYLATVHSGHLLIMDFTRDGMQRAIVRFRDHAQNLMDKAWRWVYDRSRGPVEHADALFIEHSWADVAQLLELVDALRAELAERRDP